MVDGVVLDIELLEPEFGAEPLACSSGVKPEYGPDLGLAVDRQQLAIAPQIVRARLDRRARDRRADFRVVVGDFERAEAGFAYVQRADRVFLAALAALQIGDVAHRMSSLIARLAAAPCQAAASSACRAAPQPHPARALTSSQREFARARFRRRSGFFPPARHRRRQASAAPRPPAISPIAAATGPMIPASRQLAISASARAAPRTGIAGTRCAPAAPSSPDRSSRARRRKRRAAPARRRCR